MTPEELERIRRHAATQSQASVRLEGHEVSEYVKGLQERWIRDEISTEELIQLTIDHYRQGATQDGQ